MIETETYTTEGPDGDTGALEFPTDLVGVFAEQGEDPTGIVADVVVRTLAQQARVVVYYSEGGAPADIAEIDKQTEKLFEDRFGVPLSGAFDHLH